MNLYNIEAFSRSYEYHDSCQLADISYDDDYLHLTTNKISVPIKKWNAQKNDFIRIQSDTEEKWGTINKISYEDNYTVVTIKSLLSFLDINIYPGQFSGTIENWIASLLESIYSTNYDDYQRIQGFTVDKISQTSGIVSIDDDAKISNLYNDIILQVFENYGIVVDMLIDIQAKKFNVKVGKKIVSEKIIETDLGNVKASLVLKNTTESANKVTVYNKENMSEKITYYLQLDGLITDTPTSRIVPVIEECIAKTYNPDKETFSDVAYDEAFSRLKSEQLNHLIEIECIDADQLIDPLNMMIGQWVKILINDSEYRTMLTGKKYKNNKVILSFGTTRIEFSKRIKKGWDK